MDDFNFLHSSLIGEKKLNQFNLKTNFSKNYFAHITLIFVGEDHRSLLNSSLNPEAKKSWELIYEKSLDVFCRLREINNYSTFILDVKNKDVNKEVSYLQEFKSRGHIFDIILIEGDISVQNLAKIVKQEKCKLLGSGIEENNLKNLIAKIVEDRKKELNELNERNWFLNSFGQDSKSLMIPEDLYCGSLKIALSKCISKLDKNGGHTIFIWGEKGVGKKKLAELVHLNTCSNEKELKIINLQSVPTSYLDKYFFDKKIGVLSNSTIGTICLTNLRLRDEENKKVLKKIFERKKNSFDLIIVLEEKKDIESNLDNDLNKEFLKSNVEIEPLRNRKHEVKSLLKHYLIKFQKLHNNYFTVNQKILNSLENYNWPGNLIELENLIEGICVTFDKKELELEDLPPKYIKELNREENSDIKFGDDGFDLNNYLKNLETKLIKKALEKTNGNKNKASKLLSINRTTLIEKMKKRNIHRCYPKLEC